MKIDVSRQIMAITHSTMVLCTNENILKYPGMLLESYNLEASEKLVVDIRWMQS